MTQVSIDGKMVEKVYVDWEINSVLQQLENLALEKAAARNRTRMERGDSPVKGLEKNTIEWYARDIILQLQRELSEMTDKKEELEKRAKEFIKEFIAEESLVAQTIPEKKIPKRRVKTDPSVS